MPSSARHHAAKVRSHARSSIVLFAILMTLARATQAEELHLEPYWPEKAPSLVTTRIFVDGQVARVLFDTGAGITSITPEFARRIGCAPKGTLTGFRMRGDRVITRKCGPHDIALGGKTLKREIAVFDLASLLPPDAPAIDGIMGLDALDGRLITLSLSRRTITTDRRQGYGWREGKMRVAREAGGAALTVFAQAAAQTGDLWVLLDTGHMGPVFLSPGALDQLGSPPDLPITLGLTGAGARDLKAVRAEGLIYDGVLGEPFLRDFDIAVDFQHQQIWWRTLK